MKLKPLIVIMLVIMNIIFLNINKAQAVGIGDVIKGGDNFLSAGDSENIVIDEGKLQNTSNMVVNILILVGMAIAVIISGILGIKFMIGSVEEKAQIKDALIPFVIGCIVIFGAFGIWKIFVNIGRSL